MLADAAVVVPIVVALITGGFAYGLARSAARKAAKAESERVAKAAKIESDRAALENRRLNQDSYEALNRALTKEIDRLREDRAEDAVAHRDELHGVASELNKVRDKCAKQGDELRALESWAWTVVDVLNRPPVATVLAAEQLVIPPPPMPRRH